MGDGEQFDKREYVNTTNGYLGVTTLNHRGDQIAVPLEPGQRIFLSDTEIKLTSSAVRDPRMSPLEPQDFEVRDMRTGDVLKSGRRPQLMLVDDFVAEHGPVEDLLLDRMTPADNDEEESDREVPDYAQPHGR